VDASPGTEGGAAVFGQARGPGNLGGTLMGRGMMGQGMMGRGMMGQGMMGQGMMEQGMNSQFNRIAAHTSNQGSSVGAPQAGGIQREQDMSMYMSGRGGAQEGQWMMDASIGSVMHQGGMEMQSAGLDQKLANVRLSR
jgi:hypothetical protein